MAYARFIDTNYLFFNKILDPNIDPDIINLHIDDAQNINIQSALGYGLYHKIMDDISSTNTTTGVYLELLTDYIQVAQSRWVLYRMPEWINYRMTNKAVSEKNSDNSKPTDISNVIYLKNSVRNDAEFYTQRIREFILNNSSSLPEYYSNGNRMGAIKPKSNNYFGGIYLPKYTNTKINPQYGDPSCPDGY